MPRRPCTACGALLTAGHPCPGCQRRPRNGSSRQWRRVRGLVLDRDGHRCTRCGATESLEEPLEVHHLVPVAEGGTMEPDRLTVLCSDCHHAAH